MNLGKASLADHLLDLVFLVEGCEDAFVDEELLQLLEELLILGDHLLDRGVVHELQPHPFGVVRVRQKI